MLWSMGRLSELKVATTCRNQKGSSGATFVSTSGRNLMEQEDLTNVPNVEAQTSIELPKIEDTPELEEAADISLRNKDNGKREVI